MAHLNPLGIPLVEIGRDIDGRFRPGNKGGPGNPFARKVASLRKTLLDAVSEKDLKQMVEVLKQQALGGDKAAIKLIFQYCVGKPEPVKDPDRMDIDEWDRLQQMSVSDEEFEKTTESIPACIACEEAETAWPCNLQQGPLAETIHHIHTHLHDADRSTPEPSACETATQPTPPTEPTAPTAQNHPAPANSSPKPNARREPTRATSHSRRSPAQLPSPNEENGEEQRRTLERLQRAFQPAEQPEQPPRD